MSGAPMTLIRPTVPKPQSRLKKATWPFWSSAVASS